MTPRKPYPPIEPFRIGRLAVGSIVSSDFALAQGAIMVMAVSFMVINLLVDVLYALLDPRIQK